jgi:hypothetical protein
MSNAQESKTPPHPAQDGTSSVADASIALVREALSRLSYGAIQLTIHDGKLVQLDVTERTRFASATRS